MRQLFKFIITIFLFKISLFANYQSIYIPDQLKQDISEGKISKYQTETIPTASLAELQQRAVLGSNATLTKHISGTPTFDAIVAADVCRVDNPQAYTSTIYEMDLPSGTITCMYSAKGDLYNPMGLFKVFVPEIKAYYSVDIKVAETAKAAEIAAAEAQFVPLIEKKRLISNQVQEQINDNFLTIPEMLMAAILTDDEIIDIGATRATGKFTLKQGYTSRFNDNGVVVDNSEYILTKAATIFEVYAGLAKASMNFLLLLTVGFGAYGLARFGGVRIASKAEDKRTSELDSTYFMGIVLGVLLLFPTNSTNTNGQAGADNEFEILKTNYQGFEKFGYYNFGDWGKAAAKVIIDAEINSLIRDSGLGTKEQIASTWAQKQQSEKLDTVYTANYNACVNNIYKSSYLTRTDGKTVFGENDKSMFPSTEHWAYVALAAKSLTEGYYEKGSGGSLQDSAAGEGQYPKIAFSACGKADYMSNFHKDRVKQFEASYNLLTDTSVDNSAKLGILSSVFEFQYKLYKDWGYLAVLGLPIIKMQAEYIGGFKSQTNEVLDKLNDRISGDNRNLHSIMSTLPYMFVPGAHNVYGIVKDNSLLIGAAVGGVAGASAAQDGVLSGLLGLLGAAVGGSVGAIPGGDAALGVIFSYQASQIVLGMLPIVGLIAVGLMRFAVIILKIFSFHFGSLFMLPIMFLQNNLKAMGRLSVKILATMLEIPVFVLSIYLAYTATSLVYTIGHVFSKESMIGLLDNSLAASQTNPQGQVEVAGVNLSALFIHSKIYFFDGFMEILMSVFSIVVAYKIIVSLHTSLFEMFEMHAANALDNSIESMRQEGSSWGARI